MKGVGGSEPLEGPQGTRDPVWPRLKRHLQPGLVGDDPWAVVGAPDFASDVSAVKLKSTPVRQLCCMACGYLTPSVLKAVGLRGMYF